MRSVPLELALELIWNVLNSAFVLPCLRGARLAETKDRVDWGLFGLTQVPASNALEVVSGKPLEPFNSTFGETRVQVPLGFWLPRSVRMSGLGHPHGLPTGWWLAVHVPVVRPSEHVRQPALFFWELQRKERFKIHAPPRESRACDTRHWRAKSQEVHIARALGKLFDAFVLGTRYRASSTRLCQGSFGQRFV